MKRIDIDARPELDTRPRCVLVVGNGVSIDFVSNFGLSDRINLKQLIPPPSWVNESDIAVDGSEQKAKLWSKERYPELFSAWEDFFESTASSSFQGFCEFGARNRAFWPSEVGSQCYVNRSPGIQLRYYLWHLFVSYDSELRANLRVSLDELFEWRYAYLIRSLLLRYRLTVVSYSYDFFVEPVLNDLGMKAYVTPRDCVSCWLSRYTDEVCVLKPHGTIAHSCHAVGGAEGGGFVFISNMQAPTEFRYPPERLCPALPDLVPPGHDESHFANRLSGVGDAVRLAVRDSDVLVCAGFSAAGPDEAEFRKLCGYLEKPVCLVSIGLADCEDESNNASRLLRSAAVRHSAFFRFFDASVAHTVSEWLQSTGIPQRAYVHRYQYFRSLAPEYYPFLRLDVPRSCP